MLKLAIFFAVVALIAGALGFTGIAGASAGIAKIIFFIFLVLVALAILGIVLFHDTQAQTARMLPALLHDLKQQGYRVVHVAAR